MRKGLLRAIPGMPAGFLKSLWLLSGHAEAVSFSRLKHLSVGVTGDGTAYRDYTWTHGMGATPLAVIATMDMTGIGNVWIVSTFNPSSTTVSFRIYRRDGVNWSSALTLKALGVWAPAG